ncbi:hypothetical protein DVH05_015571 [Phytophthora capsici]|nr:hypothetical protein DVH05_015571 [Phytophthora capsici]
MTARTVGLRLLFYCLNVYTVVSFVLTSSTLYPFWPTSAAFLDDLHNGLYLFQPRTQIDRVMLDEMQAKSALVNKNVLVLGYQDHHHNALGSASHCYRLGVDKGSSLVITYYGDQVARRSIHKFHGSLPTSCMGYTVPYGHLYDSKERIYHVNDARTVIGQSFLHCTDPVLSLTEHYDPSLSYQRNNTEFPFKASYVIVQQHFSNAYFGIECQVSYCMATQVENAPGYWKVRSADPNDTKAHVNVLFTPKPLLLDLLELLGQILMWFVILRELWRAMLDARNVRVPTKRPPHHFQTDWFGLPNPQVANTCTYLDAGASRLSLSRVWLSNPLYMIGNVAHAIGTTVESQMAAEVLYWQYSKSGRLEDLLYAGIYAMRHSWVGLGLCSILRLLLDILLKSTPQRDSKWASRQSGGLLVAILTGVLRHVRNVLLYVSPKPYILAFSAAAIVTVQGRGVFYLWGIREIQNLGGGIVKSSFWGSEVAQSLISHHVLALVFVYFVALALRTTCRSSWPTHERNSLILAIDRRMWWTSFDVTDFLLTTPSVKDGNGQIVFVTRSLPAFLDSPGLRSSCIFSLFK